MPRSGAAAVIASFNWAVASTPFPTPHASARTAVPLRASAHRLRPRAASAMTTSPVFTLVTYKASPGLLGPVRLRNVLPVWRFCKPILIGSPLAIYVPFLFVIRIEFPNNPGDRQCRNPRDSNARSKSAAAALVVIPAPHDCDEVLAGKRYRKARPPCPDHRNAQTANPRAPASARGAIVSRSRVGARRARSWGGS